MSSLACRKDGVFEPTFTDFLADQIEEAPDEPTRYSVPHQIFQTALPCLGSSHTRVTLDCDPAELLHKQPQHMP